MLTSNQPVDSTFSLPNNRTKPNHKLMCAFYSLSHRTHPKRSKVVLFSSKCTFNLHATHFVTHKCAVTIATLPSQKQQREKKICETIPLNWHFVWNILDEWESIRICIYLPSDCRIVYFVFGWCVFLCCSVQFLFFYSFRAYLICLCQTSGPEIVKSESNKQSRGV